MTDNAHHDVFLSFSSLDSANALLVCRRLEADGLRCWISLRDVKPGENYQAAIVQAIQSAKIMVLLFSSNSNSSAEVSKELSLASAFKVHVIPVRTSEVQPQGAFLYELATRQWIDAFNGWDIALDNLVRTVKRVRGGVEDRNSAVASPGMTAATERSSVVVSSVPGSELEAARVALAQFVGPIAKLMVRKAAGSAASVEDFHRILAGNLPSPEEKKAFLAGLRNSPRAASS